MCISLTSKSISKNIISDNETVFKKLVEVLPQCKFKVSEINPSMGKIVAKTGISLFSWGENITINIYPTNDGCMLNIKSAAKMGFVFSSIHLKNINTIFTALDYAIRN